MSIPASPPSLSPFSCCSSTLEASAILSCRHPLFLFPSFPFVLRLLPSINGVPSLSSRISGMTTQQFFKSSSDKPSDAHDYSTGYNAAFEEEEQTNTTFAGIGDDDL